MYDSKIRKVGNSLGIILSKDFLRELKASEGDEITFERNGNEFRVKVSDGETQAMMDAAEEIMERRFKVLKALSK